MLFVMLREANYKYECMMNVKKQETSNVYLNLLINTLAFVEAYFTSLYTD